jgi:hypothetical protein
VQIFAFYEKFRVFFQKISPALLFSDNMFATGKGSHLKVYKWSEKSQGNFWRKLKYSLKTSFWRKKIACGAQSGIVFIKNNWPAERPFCCAEFGNWPVALHFYGAEFGGMSDEFLKKFACGAILMWFCNNLTFLMFRLRAFLIFSCSIL